MTEERGLMDRVLPEAATASWLARVHAQTIGYRAQWTVLTLTLVAADAVAVWCSLGLAYLVRLSSGLLAYYATYRPDDYSVFQLLSVPLYIAMFAGVGLYRPDRLLGGLDEYGGVMRGSLGGIISIIVLSFFMGDGIALSRGWLLLAWGFSILLVGGGRFAVRRAAYALQRRGYLTARVLIVGANDQGLAMAEQWLRSPTSGMAVVGFLDDFKPVGTQVIDGLEVLGRPTALDAVAHQVNAQEVVIVSGAVAWESFQEVLGRPLKRNGYTVRLSPGFYATLGTSMAVNNKSFVPLLTVSGNRLVGLDVVFKFVLDYTLAFVGCICTLPIMALIAAGLGRTALGRPVLDRHKMLGLGRRPFRMWKFRARPGGSWLEALLLETGLDKLPQFFNVLSGTMSLVGPRPRAVSDGPEDPNAVQNLHTVKPGMIGPWTIDATWLSGDEQQDEIYYVRNWTVWLDLQVILQTTLAWLRLGRQRHTS